MSNRRSTNADDDDDDDDDLNATVRFNAPRSL